MNLDIKMVIRGDKKQSIELTWRFFIKLIFDFIFFHKILYDNDKTMQSNF